MRSQESFRQSNAAAGTFGPFTITGGRYQLSAEATFGSLAVQQLMPNGTAVTLFGQPSSATPNTWVNALAANGVLTFLDLPPGQYQIVATAGSAYYTAFTRVPLE